MRNRQEDWASELRNVQLYPAHIPQLSLNDPVNLSADHVKVLNRVLQEQAKAKVGDAMIYDVSQLGCCSCDG